MNTLNDVMLLKNNPIYWTLQTVNEQVSYNKKPKQYVSAEEVIFIIKYLQNKMLWSDDDGYYPVKIN